MPKRYQIYKCEVCGNIVQIVHAGVGTLVCCNKSMRLLEEKNKDEGAEKHVPVIEKTDTGIMVKVGSISHPMEENHYIEWIEVQVGDTVYRQHLSPGQAPEAKFIIKSDEKIIAHEFCTVHGLWRN